ncbi:MAG: class I SAM-dependent methyltransferase [Candidatus Eisenbacteria bacterium]|nr:class I SAM-dependent methyltransferase [Candidatus Eisenbacteria bacterium]
MPMRIPDYEKRTPEQLREHYEIEKELAARLRSAPRDERRRLYGPLYDELFRRVPHHPQLTEKRDPGVRAADVARQMRFVRRFLTPDSVFLEVGAGDCGLSLEVAKVAKKVTAVDVSAEIAAGEGRPANFELVLSDGTNIPMPAGSVTLAYSKSTMEHLHPEDALEQLTNIHAALARAGRYVCLTPNRLSGPYDISRYFDDVATGFHLKEYTLTELAAVFRSVGFTRLTAYAGGKGTYVRVPVFLVLLTERLLRALPPSWCRAAARTFLMRALLGIAVVGVK